MKLLFVHPSVSDISILKKSTLNDVILSQTNEIVLNDILRDIEKTSHISFMFHTSIKFPFHITDEEIPISRSGHLFFHSFTHFLKRIKERKKECKPENQTLYIDFLSCNFNTKHIIRLLGKRNVIQYLDNIVLRVSTNDTGNKPYADWTMEYSTDLKEVHIKETYFNNNIHHWDVILDGDIIDNELEIYEYNDIESNDLSIYTSIYFKVSTDPKLKILNERLFESSSDSTKNIKYIFHEQVYGKQDGFYPGLETVNQRCFYNCSTLEQENLFQYATGLKYIYALAFYNTNITDIDFTKTNNLDEIGISAFSSCASLETIILNPNTRTIGKSVFKDCQKLTSIVFHELLGNPIKLTTIPAEFAYNTALTQITIPQTIDSIGTYAFSNISTLQDVVFRESNKSINFNSFCFENTSNLKSFIFPRDRINIQVKDNVFESSGLEKIEITKNINMFENNVFLNCKSLTLCTFQDYINGNIDTIKDNCFSGCTSLEEFHVPQYIQTIGKKVFEGCTSMEVFIFMNSPTIKTIGESVFNGCTKLQFITLPKSVTELGNNLFQQCTGLTEVNLKDTNISMIPVSCFSGCISLSTIELNDGCHTIKTTAFQNCKTLYSITFGSGLTTIEENAFVGCTTLIDIENNNTLVLVNNDKNINVSIDPLNINTIKNKNDWVYKIEYISNNEDLQGSNITDKHRNFITEIVFNAGLTTTIPSSRFMNYASIYKVTLPNNITTIPEQCFMNSNIYQIDIPNNIIEIGPNAFSGCKRLQVVNMDIDESQLTTIGIGSFKETNLEIIEIPNNVTSIGERSFYNCSFLKHVLLPKNIQTIGNSAFVLCNAQCVYIFNLYDYEETIDLYNLKTTNNLFTIHEDTETYNNNPRFFYAKQKMDSSSPIDDANKTYIYDISFDDTITTIKSNVASNTKIQKIIIPNNVENIEKYAFFNCNNLKHVEIGNKTTLILNDAFRQNHPHCIYIIDNYANNVTYSDNTFTTSNIYFKKKYFVYQYQLNEHAVNYQVENVHLTEFTITNNTTYYESITIFPDNARTTEGNNIIEDSFKTFYIDSVTKSIIDNNGIVNDDHNTNYVNINMHSKHNKTLTDDINGNDIYDAIRCDVTIKIDTSINKNLHIGYLDIIELEPVTYIPVNCFKDALQLQSVRIPRYNGVVLDIKGESFFGCNQLTTFIRDKPWNKEDVNIGTVRTYFTGPNEPVNHIYFSELKFNSNDTINDYAQFTNYTENNKYIRILTLENTDELNELPDNIFENLTLTTITIPANITKIGTDVLKHSDVRIVNVNKTTKEWNTIEGVENIIEKSLNEDYIIIIKEEIYSIELYKNSYLPSTLHNKFIENDLYEQYSDIAYPLLNSFKSITWQQNGYTNVMKTPNIIKILNGLFYTFYENIFHIHEETKTVSLLDHIVLDTNTNIGNTFIYIPRNWTFNGNGYHIDITGIHEWKGLFICSEENPYNEYVFIKNIGVVGGVTQEKGGFILRSNMNFVSIHNSFSTGYIHSYSGGIIGNNCKHVILSESFSIGEIGNYGGGIVGYDTGSNIKVHSCYSSGNINENACGILAQTTLQSNNIELHDCYSSGDLLTMNGYGIYHSNNVNNQTFSIQYCYSKVGIFELYNNIFNIDFYTYAKNTDFDTSYNKFEQNTDLKYPFLKSFTKFPYNTYYTDYPIPFYDNYLFGVFKMFHNEFYFSVNNKTIYLESDIVIDSSIYTSDSYIYLHDGWKFQGNGNKININGIDNWTGLLRCDNILNHIVENVAVINGKTELYCGYILHKEQENVTINRCYVENGIIGKYGGGLVGAYSGTFGNFINISQCYVKGSFEEYSGGLIGAYSGRRGNIKVENSYIIIEPNGISSFCGCVIGSHSCHYGNISFKTMYVLQKKLDTDDEIRTFDDFSYVGKFSDSFRINYKDCFINKNTSIEIKNIDNIDLFLALGDEETEEDTEETTINNIETIFNSTIFNITYDETNVYNDYSEDNYPTLKCFNQLPWSNMVEFHGIFNDYNPIYNIQDSWFDIDDINKIILLNQSITISDYIDYDTYLYKDTFITMSSGYTFNGNNKFIDLSGIDSWKGLIKSNAIVDDLCIIKDIGVFNGKTHRGAGYILQSYQNNVEIDSCFSYGEINDYGGGIIGEFCGVVFEERNNDRYVNEEIQSFISISNSHSNGDIYNHSGGITGPYCCQGNCNMIIKNCFTTGNIIGLHASGILGKFCGNNHGYIEIKGCITYGTISGYNASGIVGYNIANNNGTCNIEYTYSTSQLINKLPKFIMTAPFNALFEGNFNVHHFYFVDNNLNDYENVHFVGNFIGEYDGSYNISKTLFLYTDPNIEPDNYIPEFSSFSSNIHTSNDLYGLSFLNQTDISNINHTLESKSNNIEKQSDTNEIRFKQDELNNIGLPLVNTFTSLPWSSLEYHHYDTIPVFSVFKDLWVTRYSNANEIKDINLSTLVYDTDNDLYTKLIDIINQVTNPDLNEPLVVIKQMYDELFNIHFSINDIRDGQTYQKLRILNTSLNIDLNIDENIKQINIFNSYYFYNKDNNCFIVDFETLLDGNSVNDDDIDVPLFYTYIQRGFSLKIRNTLERIDVFMISIDRDMNGTDYIIKYLTDLNRVDEYTFIITDISQTHRLYIKNNDSSLYHFNIYFKPIFMLEYIGTKTLSHLNLMDASI